MRARRSARSAVLMAFMCASTSFDNSAASHGRDLAGSHPLHQGVGRPGQVGRLLDRRQREGDGPVAADRDEAIETQAHGHRIAVLGHLHGLVEDRLGIAVEDLLQGLRRRLRVPLGRPAGFRSAPP